MNLVDDAIFWCCQQPVESENYGMDDPLTPWRGKLRVVTRNGGTVLYLHRFNRETGEIDEDTNATSFVKEDQIFETRKQANEYYKMSVIYAARSHMRTADALLESIGTLSDEETDDH